MYCIQYFLHALSIARTLHKDQIITAYITKTRMSPQLSKSPEPKDSEWTPDQWQTRNGKLTNKKQTKNHESQNTPAMKTT